MDKRRKHDDVAGMDDWEFAVVVRRRNDGKVQEKEEEEHLWLSRKERQETNVQQ